MSKKDKKDQIQYLSYLEELCPRIILKKIS